MAVPDVRCSPTDNPIEGETDKRKGCRLDIVVSPADGDTEMYEVKFGADKIGEVREQLLRYEQAVKFKRGKDLRNWSKSWAERSCTWLVLCHDENQYTVWSPEDGAVLVDENRKAPRDKQISRLEAEVYVNGSMDGREPWIWAPSLGIPVPVYI